MSVGCAESRSDCECRWRASGVRLIGGPEGRSHRPGSAGSAQRQGERAEPRRQQSTAGPVVFRTPCWSAGKRLVWWHAWTRRLTSSTSKRSALIRHAYTHTHTGRYAADYMGLDFYRRRRVGCELLLLLLLLLQRMFTRRTCGVKDDAMVKAQNGTPSSIRYRFLFISAPPSSDQRRPKSRKKNNTTVPSSGKK